VGLSDRHFLNSAGPGFASNDGAIPTEPEISEKGRCRFEVYRTDHVPMTTTLFAGGDWRWRLSEHDGKVLVEAGGYRSERHCREAVTILQARAAFATLA
jgi:uncharacterized protein YegP (UPF0339 family)